MFESLDLFKRVRWFSILHKQTTF